MKKLFLLFLLANPLMGMSIFQDSAETIVQKAGRLGWNREYVDISSFSIMTCYRLKKTSDTIRIYIEGDGKAWKTRRTLSDDPTPANPIALKLALIDPSDAVVYLARPGQFASSSSSRCDSAYWSSRRFAPEVVKALDDIIEMFKGRVGARHVEIVGYSGGGALAVLIAARRNDVASLRTVAGNLDPSALHAYHRVSPLNGSLDPLDAAGLVAHIPQRHFVGTKDRIVPALIAAAFIKRAGGNAGWMTLIDATHQDGWQERWNALLALPLGTKL